MGRKVEHMADQTLRRLLAKARENHAGRSEAYCWLRARFEHLHPLLAQRRLTFQQVADDLVLGGRRGGRGKPVTADAVRRIWHRVQRDVATEEPGRMGAVRTALQHGTPAQKPRSRKPERGVNADQPPPVVTTPAPRPPVPHYPPPPAPPAQAALPSCLNASPHADGRTQTPEEMRADIRATIKRRSQYF